MTKYGHNKGASFNREENAVQKVDKTVAKETVYIAVCSLIFSMLLEAVFLILHRWDYTVLLGNLLGYAAAVLNFFLMGLTVQKAVNLDEEGAKNRVKMSQSLRMFMLIAFAAAAFIFPCFNVAAFAVPLIFPRIAIFFRPYFDKKNKEE